jgi:hypothetical protein
MSAPRGNGAWPAGQAEASVVPAAVPASGRGIGLRATLLAASVAVALAMLAAGPAPGRAQERQQGKLDRFEKECGANDTTAEEHGGEEGLSRLSDKCKVLAVIPKRPHALIELGEPFLGTGTLHKGIKLPGGAVWQPALLAFGTIRTAVQGGRFNPGSVDVGEAVGRVDLFGNLYLTQTERILVGLRPLDQDGRFTGYYFATPPLDSLGNEDKSITEFNAKVQTLFFEGDLGEIFPNLDNDDSGFLDIYFSVGRQPLNFGDGLLLNDDALDMVGLTRANMKIGSTVNTRITGVYAWGQINRPSGGANVRDDAASLVGLFSEIDLRATTLQIDAAYVFSDPATGNGLSAGIGDIRRIGQANNTFRVLASFPVGDETRFNSSGVLIHDQFSWTPKGNNNLWYVSGFAGIGQFRSASRGPSAGGPLGQTGILFAAPGIGRIGGALTSLADDAVGGALGHQFFFGATRQQLVLEAGGRMSTDSNVVGGDFAAFGGRFQSAMGRRAVVVVDGVTAYNFEDSALNLVGRLELQIQM